MILYSSKHAEIGEKYSDLESRLIYKLSDTWFVKNYLRDLEKAGFSLNKEL